MLETYLTEIIATAAIFILIIIYLIIKKSQKKQKSTVKDQEENISQETVTQDVNEDNRETTEKAEPSKDEDLTTLSGEEEGSFGVDKTKKVITEEETPVEPLVRIKRTVPPHGKITKDNFKVFKGQRILVAEDNIINQKVITGLLGDSGIELTMAEDGQIVLEILEQDSNYNIILMDAHMPRIDGFEATRAIRKISAYNHIVIVALSGDTASDDIKKMIEAGMEEQLEKPLRMDPLYDILYTYAKTRATDDGQVIEKPVNTTITQEIDIEKGLNISGNDEIFYNEILNEFVATYSESPTKLRELLINGKMKQADQYLLDISGVSANIGASNINKVVLDLKMALANPADKKYINLFKDYTKSLRNLLEEIRKYKSA